MNNNLQIFKNERFGEIQIIQTKNKYEFEASGIAKILGYSKPKNEGMYENPQRFYSICQWPF